MKKTAFLICFILFTISLTAFSTPFPAKVYQVPVCASSFKSLAEVRQGLTALGSINKDLAKEYIQEQIEKGNIISASALLTELKEQYRKGLKSSSEEVLKALQKRIGTLEEIVLQNPNKQISLYPELVLDVTEEPLNETQDNNINSFRKLCNGGETQPKYPFSVFGFTIGEK